VTTPEDLPFGPALIWRLADDAPACECECGALGAYAYDIGGGMAFACFACAAQSLADGSAAISED
jgi:hypothetical protein